MCGGCRLVWMVNRMIPPAATHRKAAEHSADQVPGDGLRARYRSTGAVVMDGVVHSLSALSWCVRRLFAIACTTCEAKPARVAGRWPLGAFSLGRRPLLKEGVVTPRPPRRLPATYSRRDWLRSHSGFSGLAKEGQRA
jgi:hypothetical protein